jgi:D-sedoheptulose 7-phosphate isomerase
VITLSGFLQDNPLRTQGLLNIWLNATDYGLVEVGHQFILHNVADRFGAGYGSSGSSKA